MIKILDYLINALVSWRSKIVLRNQKQDLCCLDGKANAEDAGFKPVGKIVLRPDVSGIEPIYFPGLTENEIKALLDKQTP